MASQIDDIEPTVPDSFTFEPVGKVLIGGHTYQVSVGGAGELSEDKKEAITKFVQILLEEKVEEDEAGKLDRTVITSKKIILPEGRKEIEHDRETEFLDLLRKVDAQRSKIPTGVSPVAPQGPPSPLASEIILAAPSEVKSSREPIKEEVVLTADSEPVLALERASGETQRPVSASKWSHTTEVLIPFGNRLLSKIQKIGEKALAKIRSLGELVRLAVAYKREEKKWPEIYNASIIFRSLDEDTKLLDDAAKDNQKKDIRELQKIGSRCYQTVQKGDKDKLAELARKGADENGAVKASTLTVEEVEAKPKAMHVESGKVAIIDDCVVPTAVRGTENGNHVMNCYQTVDTTVEGGVATIRLSAIDTPEKMREAKEIIIDSYEKLKKVHGNQNLPLRVISVQLNSPDALIAERSMVEKQHSLLAQMGQDLKDELGLDTSPVAHINMSSNSFVHWTKKLRLGKFGFTGEAHSRTMNLEGIAKYVEWMQQDVAAAEIPGVHFDISFLKSANEASEKINEAYSKMGAIAREITDLKKQLKEPPKEKTTASTLRSNINAKKKELSDLKGEITKYRKVLKEKLASAQVKLLTVRGALSKKRGELEKKKALADENQKELDKCQEMHDSVSMLYDLLGSQLDLPSESMSRGREALLVHGLNQRLGIVETMNCKSGLDRTGFRSAVKLADIQMQRMGWTKHELAEMSKEWDQLTRELDGRLRTPEDYRQLETGKEPLEEKYQRVIQFRKLVLRNLIKMGIPITGKSTGALGFKWHMGIFNRNREPMNFLPTFVKDEYGNPIQLVERSSDFLGAKLTKEGHHLLTRNSASRGG